MKLTVIFVIIVMSLYMSVVCLADSYVNGYYKKDGTYVDGYYKSDTNKTNWDNYSTQDNSNPYNGNNGYKAKDYSSDAYNYGSGNTIYTGPKGGQYYTNSNGNKVYVPKR